MMLREGEDDEPILGGEDAHGSSAFPYDDVTSTGKLAHEIREHLALLKAPLPVVNSEGLMVSSIQVEGWLWAQKGYRGWKKRWFVWRYSDVHEQWNLYNYKSKDRGAGKITAAVPVKVKSILRTQNDDPTSKGMHKVTFVKRDDFSKKQHETNLAAMQRTDDLPTSKSYLRIFTRKSVIILAATDDDEIKRWNDVLSTYLKYLMGSRYDESFMVAEDVCVLLKQQYSAYLSRCQDLLQALEKNGLFEDALKHKRDKSGTLCVESGSSEDGWRKHRFVLKGDVLYHWPSDKGHKLVRAIPLKFATIEHDTEMHADGSCIFQITTPLISYVIQAKHKVSMEEWISAIERNKVRSKLSTTEKITEGVKGVAAALANFQIGGRHEEVFPDETPLLSLSGIEGDSIRPKDAVLVVNTPAKKEKSYSIKKNSMTIGRSSTNEITVEDSRLSREHCSIETMGDKLVFCDMGSKGGSKINKVRVVDRTVLQAGDTIKVGKTIITVLNK